MYALSLSHSFHTLYIYDVSTWDGWGNCGWSIRERSVCPPSEWFQIFADLKHIWILTIITTPYVVHVLLTYCAIRWHNIILHPIVSKLFFSCLPVLFFYNSQWQCTLLSRLIHYGTYSTSFPCTCSLKMCVLIVAGSVWFPNWRGILVSGVVLSSCPLCEKASLLHEWLFTLFPIIQLRSYSLHFPLPRLPTGFHRLVPHGGALICPPI